jgi:hypothetical protein
VYFTELPQDVQERFHWPKIRLFWQKSSLSGPVLSPLRCLLSIISVLDENRQGEQEQRVLPARRGLSAKIVGGKVSSRLNEILGNHR